MQRGKKVVLLLVADDIAAIAPVVLASVAFGADYVKVVEDTQILSAGQRM